MQLLIYHTYYMLQQTIKKVGVKLLPFFCLYYIDSLYHSDIAWVYQSDIGRKNAYVKSIVCERVNQMGMKNKTQYAILGILSIAPGSGYDIKKYCDTVISNIWNENFGHIYPVLNTMLKEGLIELKDDNASTRKKEYTITDKGKEEFLNWLIEPTQYKPIRSEFMLKFLFSSHLPKENIIKMLNDYKKRHEVKLEEFREMEKNFNQGNHEILPEREIYLGATLRYGILSAQATIMWCDEVINVLSKQK